VTAPLPHPPPAGDAIAGAAAAPPLRLEIVTAAEGIAARAAALEACVAATGADVYFTPGWLAAWLGTWGREGRLRLLLAWEGAALAGFLPVILDTVRAGPVPVRVARLAGTYPGQAVMGLPLPPADRPGAAAACLAAMLRQLAGPERVHAIALSPLSQGLPGLDALRAAAGQAGLGIAAEDWSRQHTVIRLPDRFETWLDGLSKNRRRAYRKDAAGLGAQGALRLQALPPEAAAGEGLAALVALHARQWQAAGKAGHFADWPEALPFARAVLPRLGPDGRAWIDEHRAGEALLSALCGFRQGPRAYLWVSGRTLDPDLLRLGVGRVGLIERLRALIEAGVREVEAGAGEYDYKLGLGGTPVAMGRLVLAAPGAGWRVRLLVAWADLLDLVYYRGWFLKLRPRLKLKPRPLWRAWRRTRL
jgi:CelD/BcsL family acetyltransferase involved in cellulose biosynthesis